MPDRIEFREWLHIRDHYPHYFCICELWLDERCHIHGTEPCLGCLVHPEGRAMEVVPEGQEPRKTMSHPWVVPVPPEPHRLTLPPQITYQRKFHKRPPQSAILEDTERKLG